jgi:phenylacetate-CoA ligase
MARLTSLETARVRLKRRQLKALQALIADLLASNPFYGPRLRAAGLDQPPRSLEEFIAALPPTTKEELVEDQARNPPYGTNLTYPLERYTRFHQTSGTTGRPLRWLDTPASWRWMLGGWVRVFETAGVTALDRVFIPFSFGPFLGFWTAFDAAQEIGCLVLPGGGLNSSARLRLMEENQVSVLCCTPTYALRLAEVANQEGFDLSDSSLRKIVVAGEPGGSVAATRAGLARAWPTAEIFDHHGMTEVGPVSFPNPRFPGLLHILESSYLAEIVDSSTLFPGVAGTPGELILTTLGRHGSPLLRYRTGDLVCASTRSPEELGVPELALEGGILARTDDMVVVRGVNLYPVAVEEILRAEPGVAEYRVELTTRRAMTEIGLAVEPSPQVEDPQALCRRLEGALRNAFQLRIPVHPVPAGALPRFELKARRWLRS